MTTTLGFVGLGHMGGNMAARFLAAGYTVFGESGHRREVQELVDKGLGWRDTPREVAESADVLFTSLPDDDVLESVASGPDGILAGLTEPKIWVDMSTVSPRVSRELSERVRAQSALGSPMLKARADLVLDLPEEAWFDVSLMQKDVALALETGRELHVPLQSASSSYSAK